MSLVAFSELPSQARLWIFPADRPLTVDEQKTVVRAVEEGLSAWSAHGSPVRWGHHIAHDQFLVLGVDESQTELTGCSIDNAVGRIRELEQRLGLSFLDNDRVFYREGTVIRCRTRSDFKSRVAAGEITSDTVVFDTVIRSLGAWREGRGELPFSQSWHARAFPLPA